MERIDQRSASLEQDGKRATLISAVQKMVSNDDRKLKGIATVLSICNETEAMAGKMMTEYGKVL